MMMIIDRISSLCTSIRIHHNRFRKSSNMDMMKGVLKRSRKKMQISTWSNRNKVHKRSMGKEHKETTKLRTNHSNSSSKTYSNLKAKHQHSRPPTSKPLSTTLINSFIKTHHHHHLSKSFSRECRIFLSNQKYHQTKKIRMI